MTDDPQSIRIDRSNHPAGGWGAVKSTFRVFRLQEIASKVGTGLLRTNQPGAFDCPGCAFPDNPGGAVVDTCEQGQKAGIARAGSAAMVEGFVLVETR